MSSEQAVVNDNRIDDQLLAAMASGQSHALAELYDRYNQRLFAIAMAILRNRQDAEDLLHDVFLACWQKSQQFDNRRGTVSQWLISSTRNRAFDRLRALTRIRNSVEAIPAIPQHKDIASLISDNRYAEKMLTSLSDKQRRVVELCYLQGMSLSEIAQSCEIPIGTVKSRLAAALVKLRQQADTQGRA